MEPIDAILAKPLECGRRRLINIVEIDARRRYRLATANVLLQRGRHREDLIAVQAAVAIEVAFGE